MSKKEDDFLGGEIRRGALVVNLKTKTVEAEGRKANLSPLQYEVMVYLIRNQDRIVSPKELIDHVWGDPYGSISQVRNVVSRIRKKLDDLGKEYRNYIQTKRGWGYQFSCRDKDTSKDKQEITNR